MDDKMFDLYDLLAEDLAYNYEEAEEYLRQNEIPADALFEEKMSGIQDQIRAFKFKQGISKNEKLLTKLDSFFQLIQEQTQDRIFELFPPLAQTAYSQLSSDGITDDDIQTLRQDSSFLRFIESIDEDDLSL